jgi:hypothetical protein
MKKTISVRHPRFEFMAPVTVRVTARQNAPEHQRDFGDTATLVVESGCSCTQFYGTAPTLRELAATLLQAADEIDAAQAEAA